MEHKITSKELVFVVVLKHQNRPGVSDIVILNENNNIVMTFCRGELAYKKGEN